MKKVLVVDDNEEILNIITIILDMEGYEVISADNGHQISETILTSAPDLILLDIMLGDLDGRELCRTLKIDPQTKHIPVIMISASHNLGCDDCSAEDFLANPFNIEDLVEKVAQYVN